MFKKFLTALVIVVMMGVPAFAASRPPVNVIYDSSFVTALDVPFGRISDYDHDITRQWLWEWFSTPVNNFGIGEVSREELSAICSSLNGWFSEPFYHTNIGDSFPSAYVNTALNGLFGGTSSFFIVEHPHYGDVISMTTTSGQYYVCNAQGAFPYSPVTASDDGSVDRTLGGTWKPYNVVDWEKVHLLTEFSLYDIASALRDVGQDNDVAPWSDTFGLKYQYIKSRWTENGQYLVYCDSKGVPYVYRPDPSQWAQEDDQDYYTDDDGDGIYDDGNTTNNQLIDLNNGVVWFPDGTLQYIDSIVYDESTKTYNIDAHQEYDITNNTYITNNYHYEYHINHTSVTYIGQTEEYNEVYEFYYKLPDGRNSADLTEEELQALNVAVDVVPYIRSADNTALRSLYHFDGNLRDSSYWSYCTGFEWASGASLTYMDAGAFNGALYLDETYHDFSVKLPSYLGVSDFTIQFRIYHSATPAPQTDSFILLGNAPVVNFTGGSWGLGESGSAISASPGNWCEVALIRYENTLYLYLNGLCVASMDDWTNYDDVVRFMFGSGQQTYKYFDELRVLDYALSKSGASYTPTAVPHDTNLTLVLPDSTVPVADEYWSFDTDGNLFPIYDLTQYQSGSDLVRPVSRATLSDYMPGSGNALWIYPSGSVFTSGYSNGAYAFTATGSYTRPSKLNSSGWLAGIESPQTFFFGLGRWTDEDGTKNDVWSSPLGLTPGKTYTFSAMTRDGELHSLSFTLPTSYSPVPYNTTVDIPGGAALGYHVTDCYSFTEYSFAYLTIYPPSDGSVEFIYLELVEGEANTGHEFVSAIVPVDADFRTPTLAVKTDLDITGYQIGGVRPSLPSKGLVWAMVESSRISSLQIYNGQAWESVDGRIWTGSRWVPYYAYDILLLKDMFDIVEGDPSLDFIYSQEGFWTWLQNAWAQMIDRLDAILAALGGEAPGGSGSPETDNTLPGVEDNPTTEEDEGWKFIDLLVLLRDGTWAVVKGVVGTGVSGLSGLAESVSNVGNFFGQYQPDASGGIFGIYTYEGEDLWT